MARRKTDVFTDYFFGLEDSMNDVSLVVEEVPIYFNRALLMMFSSVFTRMFTSDFREKEQQAIAFPEKNLREFVTFLAQIHPAYAWKPLRELELETVLKLADEYDVAHVKAKCSQFIQTRMEFTLTMDQAMSFLWLSEVYHLPELQTDLLALITELDWSSASLETCRFFPALHDSTQLQLMEKRQWLEEAKKEDIALRNLALAVNIGRMIREANTMVRTLPGSVRALPTKHLCIHCGVFPRDVSPCSSTGSAAFVTPFPRREDQADDFLHAICEGCVREKTFMVVRCLKAMVDRLSVTLSYSVSLLKKINVKF